MNAVRVARWDRGRTWASKSILSVPARGSSDEEGFEHVEVSEELALSDSQRAAEASVRSVVVS